MIVTIGDADPVVGDDTARLIWKGIGHLPGADRDYITFVSDLRGSPKLKARHRKKAAAKQAAASTPAADGAQS